jgi:hypothetical protein
VLTGSFSGIEPYQTEQGVVVYSSLSSEAITTHILTTPQYRLLENIQRHTSLGDIPTELLPELNSLVLLGLVVGFTVGNR